MIRAHGLTRRFGDQAAVRDVRFEIPTGRLVELLGPNGARKTTMVRMLSAPGSGLCCWQPGCRKGYHGPWRCEMVDILDHQRAAIAQACARFGVARLDVFGSALRDDFRLGESDLDLLVDFGSMNPHDLVDAYFGLLDELRAVLAVEVDLVMVGAVKNRFIAADIERTKQMLYAA